MYDDEYLLTSAFDELGAEADRTITVAPAERVRAIAVHRRRVRVTMLSMLALLAVGVPVAAYATLTHDSNGPPVAESPSPSILPSSPPPSSPPSEAPARPDGRIPRADLVNATIELPRSHGDDCGGGSVKLHDKPSTGQAGTVWISFNPVYANLDGDPALETAVELLCVSGDPSVVWLVALDRDDAGKIVVLGTLVGGQSTEPIGIVANLAANPVGGVNVSVCPRCGSDPTDNMWKNRHYFWDGNAYTFSAQTVPWVADLAVGVGGIKYNGKQGDRFSVTFTVTVTNRGSVPSGAFETQFVGHGGYPNERLEVAWDSQFDGSPLDPGKARSMKVTVTRDYHADYPFTNWLTVNVIQRDEAGAGARDPQPGNDSATVANFL